MNFELPLHEQKKPNTCALACLRMVLDARGESVDEGAIEAEARMEEGGTPIEEPERLAKRFDVAAHIVRTTVDELRTILAGGKLPIAYVNRAFFELPLLRRVRTAFTDPKLHAVISTRIARRCVTFHDPLHPARIRRRSLDRFERAHGFLHHTTLACEAPTNRVGSNRGTIARVILATFVLLAKKMRTFRRSGGSDFPGSTEAVRSAARKMDHSAAAREAGCRGASPAYFSGTDYPERPGFNGAREQSDRASTKAEK